MKIALVHDWFVTYAGAEKVVEEILNIFPETSVFSLVDFLDASNRSFIGKRKISTTFIQNLPFARKHFRKYLPLMPLAIEQLDLSSFDLIISSTHAIAKGVLIGPNQIHISYVHSPMRYAWDLQNEYLQDSFLNSGWKQWLVRVVLSYLRLWDLRTANLVDHFIANSQFIQKRIWRIYRRESQVIYPPVDIDSFSLRSVKEDFYLAASRLVPYKKMGLIVEAFSQHPNRKLVVAGDGPEMEKIKNLAGKNVEILGYVAKKHLIDLMQKAKAFIFAAIEDFGIAPVEAQACGTPVIALGKGGALETVLGLEQKTPTGVFFQEQTIDCLNEAIKIFEANQERFSPRICRINAERFSIPIFRKNFKNFVLKCLS